MVKNIHFSGLVTKAREQLGYTTLRSFFDRHLHNDSPISYQSWLHIEAGRRLISPEHAGFMCKALCIDPYEFVATFCRDFFTDSYLQNAVNTENKSSNVEMIELLTKARMIDRGDKQLEERHIAAFEKDVRLRMAMSTPMVDGRCRLAEVSKHLKVPIDEAEFIVRRLVDLELWTYNDGIVTEIYHTSAIPIGPRTTQLRKKLLIANIERCFKEKTYLFNYHGVQSEEAIKKTNSLFAQLEAHVVTADADPNQRGAKPYLCTFMLTEESHD